MSQGKTVVHFVSASGKTVVKLSGHGNDPLVFIEAYFLARHGWKPISSVNYYLRRQENESGGREKTMTARDPQAAHSAHSDTDDAVTAVGERKDE